MSNSNTAPQIINTTMNDLLRTTPLGGVGNSIGSMLYGINHRHTPTQIPVNKDGNGFVLFTRPCLNLSTGNVRANPELLPLLTTESMSYQRMIRCYLDPRTGNDPAYPCPFVDPRSAFIPLMTNLLETCSGWPDSKLDTFISKPGVYREVYGMTDSVVDKYLAFDLSASFRNVIGDPITMMLQTWLEYQGSIFEGTMVRYLDFIRSNEIDYQIGIWRLVMDPSRRFVQKIARTGASWPISNPLGSAFNYEREKIFNGISDQITVEFKSIGFNYNHENLIFQFNRLVGAFNPNMKDNYRNQFMKKIPLEALTLFNNMGYPRIDPNSKELQWYVSNDRYIAVMRAQTRHMEAMQPTRQIT